jgi:glyoxylase-like metal-dependent hydrolase (beta-lactamase superfamily II)
MVSRCGRTRPVELPMTAMPNHYGAGPASELKKIDYLLTTHFHGDHYGALPALVTLIPIGVYPRPRPPSSCRKAIITVVIVPATACSE